MSELTVAAGLARRLIDFARSEGADLAELEERSQVRLAELDDQDARIEFEHYVSLMRAAKELTGDPALALRFGRLPMSDFSVVGLLFQTCETVLESIVQINRYGKLIIEVDLGAPDRFQFVKKAGTLWLVDTRRDPNHFPELTEATFARFISMTKPFCENRLVEEVHVTHPAPPHAATYEALLGAPTRFAMPWNALRVDEQGLKQPIGTQPRYAFAILSDHAGALLRKLEDSHTLRAKVEALIIPILHTGTASIDRIALKLGFSRQTLFRKLKAEGVTFELILDELRHNLAVHYLSGGRVSVGETAYLVGFSDPAAFSRAFRRWTGMSPAEVRKPKR
jgi:AraC-like DNA-binding protein